MITRRAFLCGLTLGMVSTPVVTRAQQPGTVYRIGVLWPGASPPRAPRMEAFRQGLRESGYVERQNLAIELRYGEPEQLAALAAELIKRDIRVIATFGDLAPRAARRASTAIPIVVLTDDIVGAGLVDTLARPGGNITGVTLIAHELGAKRLELLREIFPKVSRVATLLDPASGTSQLQPMEAAARAMALHLQVVEVRGANDLGAAFKAVKEARAGALNVMSSPLLASLSRKIIDLAAKNRVPTIYQWREAVEAGGLMSYGPSLFEMWRQTGLLVGKILKGARPADIPVEQPAKFELILNLRTAKALGLTIPESILVRADEIVQ